MESFNILSHTPQAITISLPLQNTTCTVESHNNLSISPSIDPTNTLTVSTHKANETSIISTPNSIPADGCAESSNQSIENSKEPQSLLPPKIKNASSQKMDSSLNVTRTHSKPSKTSE